MKTAYVALVAILLLNLTLFSQTGTNKEPQVCMPLSRAQRIAQDLLRYDSVRTELNSVYEIVKYKDSQIVKLNKINTVQIEKIDSLNSEIAIHEEKFKTADTRVTELQSENTKLQTSKNNLKNWCIGLGSGLITTIGSLLLVISIK
jgi:hypothetical protein